MTDYCLFTVEHPEARRVYLRGIADVTEPIDDYDKIIKFYNGSKLSAKLPKNPFNEDSEEHRLYNELVSALKSQFEEFGSELIFVTDDEKFLYQNKIRNDGYFLDMEKVTI